MRSATGCLSAFLLLALAACEPAGEATADPASTSEFPDAVSADPAHYSVEFENEVVRLLRVRYGPGESSTMHHHPAICVILLTDHQADFELPTGETREGLGVSGDVNCADAEAHAATNTADEPFEVILVELKGRETAG